MNLTNILSVWCASLLLFILAMQPGIAQDAKVSEDSLQHVVERAANAGMSAEKLQTLVDRSRSAGLSNRQIAELINPAAELSEQDLPGKIIIQKAFEGLAKGIPPNRIHPVILDLKVRIQEAEKVVDPWMKNNGNDEQENYITKNGNERSVRLLLIEATANALSADANEKQITGLLGNLGQATDAITLHPRTLATAIQILPDLITTEQDPDLSYQLLTNAVNAGFTATDLNQLPQAMMLAKQNSRLPAKAVASGFTRQIENGLTASQIIQNLQLGKVKGAEVGPDIDKKQPKGPDQNPAADRKNSGGKQD
jgi:hypothetical protein